MLIAVHPAGFQPRVIADPIGIFWDEAALDDSGREYV